ncbi:MAG: hypothetical protein Kow0047_17960 [Anaerolineae bacterium]
MPSYAASKHGFVGITRTLANELPTHHINVNAIAPGHITADNATPLRAIGNGIGPSWNASPQAGGARLNDLEGTKVFLASWASDYMHGSIVAVDGGWLSCCPHRLGPTSQAAGPLRGA